MTDTLGLYLHIPFCVSKCRYCDFYSVAQPERMDAFALELCRRIAEAGRRLSACAVDTVYLGGGTPSLLGGERCKGLLYAVTDAFSLTDAAEITVECNPESTDPALLTALRQAGVNRLSIGVQSADDRELALLGRAHTFSQAVQAVDAAQQQGFANISLDLMYGLPGQTGQTFLRSLEAVLALHPQHLSCYGLKLEPNTPMGREQPVLPGDDAQAETYLALCDRLRQAGFLHYEISNFAKPGFASRHNSRYWDLSEYLGLGPGAHSFLHGRRFSCPRDLDAFLRGAERTEEEDTVADFSGTEEYLMLRLRTASGVCPKTFQKRFRREFSPYIQAFRQLAQSGLAQEEKKGNWHLTERGFLVSNAAICFVTDAGR